VQDPPPFRHAGLQPGGNPLSRHYGLYFGPSVIHLSGFCDSSHAADPNNRKSHVGHIFYLNPDGSGNVWGPGKESVVAISSMESEYMQFSEAAKEAIFLHKLAASIGLKLTLPLTIYTDSESALKHVKNNVKHARTKHIDTRFHYVREAYTSGQTDLQYVPSSEQAADIFMKPLRPAKHVEAVKLLKLTLFSFVEPSSKR